MPSMAEMVEAHLLNVQREINNLKEKKVAIDVEISKLETYLKEGAEELKTSQAPPPVPVQSTDPAAGVETLPYSTL